MLFATLRRIREEAGMDMKVIATGGLVYTLGAIAYVTHRPRLWPRVFSYHEVFHVCVVAGASLHYAAVLLYLAPFGLA